MEDAVRNLSTSDNDESTVCFLTCVLWILKSTEALLAMSSFGMLCSMASQGKSHDAELHNSRQHQLTYGLVNKYISVTITLRFDSHFSLVRTTLAFPLMSLVRAPS